MSHPVRVSAARRRCPSHRDEEPSMWSALCLGGALALGQPPAPPVSPQPALPNPAPIDARPASPGSGLGGFVPTVRADPPAAAPDSPTGDSNTGNGNNGSDEKTQKD